jgi:hypothetical protein
MNLNTLIDSWIGEEEKLAKELPNTLFELQAHYMKKGVNYKIQDLKSRKQELIEALEKNYEITERF